ncbi:MAG TPA: T9SS type A sorting domain-containing protein, partial [Saprospiraceae bacterium]|nr:T9SS type A sorting domain-containing protein [Saprospiraceae bacterium]
NNSHFTIDHSKDGINFIEVGRVEAKQERSGEKDYSFAHESPAKGINYYRLNQFDLDGKKTSFGILAGNFEGGKEQFLFPTSAVNEVWLSGYESAPVKIFDASGKELINELYQTGNSIDVSNLQSGVYFLLIGQDRLSFLKH